MSGVYGLRSPERPCDPRLPCPGHCAPCPRDSKGSLRQKGSQAVRVAERNRCDGVSTPALGTRQELRSPWEQAGHRRPAGKNRRHSHLATTHASTPPWGPLHTRLNMVRGAENRRKENLPRTAWFPVTGYYVAGSVLGLQGALGRARLP